MPPTFDLFHKLPHKSDYRERLEALSIDCFRSAPELLAIFIFQGILFPWLTCEACLLRTSPVILIKNICREHQDEVLNFSHLGFIKVSIVVKHLESQDTKSLGFDPKEIGLHFKAKQER